jgi:inhibitor of cysteine peptidase
MKKYITLLLTVLALSFLASGAVAAQDTTDVAYNGPVKIVKVNKEFIIALPSNPTTGYSWMAHFDPDYIKLVNSTYIPYPTRHGIVGSGGIQIFLFKAIKPGKTVITMEYQRPWAETVPPIKEARYNVIILKHFPF